MPDMAVCACKSSDREMDMRGSLGLTVHRARGFWSTMPRGVTAVLRAEGNQGWPSIYPYPRHWNLPTYMEGRAGW